MLYLWWLVLLLITIFNGELPCHAATLLTKMVVAYASISPRVAPLWAAQEQGFFKKNGIEAELIFVRGAPTLVAALTSGDMQIGYTGGTAVLGASVAGVDLKILAVLTNRVTYDLVARNSYIQKNGRLVENFIKSLVESIAFLLGPANKGATLKLLQRRLRVSESEAEEGLTDMLIGMDKKPFPSLDGLRNIQRLMKVRNPNLGNAKVEDLVDDQILRRLDDGGFIDKTFAAYGVK